MRRFDRQQRERSRLWLLQTEIAAMKKDFPQFRLTQMRGEFVWMGCVQPYQNGSTYRLEIRFDGVGYPRVYVRSPQLQLAPGQKAVPHVFTDTGSLCLFYPPDGDWKPGDRLAKTILPWAILWLYYYELWLVTGEWFGGGAPHASDSEKEQPRVEQQQESQTYPHH